MSVLTKCNFCGYKGSFTSIEDDLGNQMREHGFPYPLSDFETLNFKHYSCPNCGAADRDRLYKLYIDKFLGNKSSSILDFAPSNVLRDYLQSRPGVKYRSADLYMKDVDDKVDITDMKQYRNGQFDFFICSHVVEHVSDDTKAFRELRRVLKPSGSGILMTPIIDKPGVFDEDIQEKRVPERWRRFAQDDHVRLYEKRIFLERVSSAGLEVKQFGKRQLGLINMLRYGISPKSVLYIVSPKGGK